MRKLWIVSIVGLLCAAPACSPRDFLTRRLASDLIAGSDVFKSSQQFWLRTGVISGKDYSSPEYLVLQHHGWITGTSVECEPKVLGHRASPPACWDVVLTPSGVDVFRALLPNNTSPGQSFSVPVAGNFADVEFQWKWVPMNELGAALSSGGAVYTSVVGFREYDDGWRVMQSSGHNNQSLDEALKNTDPAQ
jgi:hypothetical protein